MYFSWSPRKVPKEGDLRRAALVREQPVSAPLWLTSLVTFLFSDKKVTLLRSLCLTLFPINGIIF